MEMIITIAMAVLIFLVILSEIYKASFERKSESKDERGQFMMYKTKSLSYHFLSYSIVLGVILVAILKLLEPQWFIYYVMVIFFLQSIVSALYLFTIRRV